MPRIKSKLGIKGAGPNHIGVKRDVHLKSVLRDLKKQIVSEFYKSDKRGFIIRAQKHYHPNEWKAYIDLLLSKLGIEI
jgi:hypothetical protein